MASTHDALVIEDGAGEDPRGGLHQVPGPGVAGARVGHQSPGLETLSHHESGHVSGTLGVSWPEILLRTIIVPLEGQPSIKETLGDNKTLEMLRVSSFILHKKNYCIYPVLQHRTDRQIENNFWSYSTSSGDVVRNK